MWIYKAEYIIRRILLILTRKIFFVCFNGIAAEWPLRVGKSWSEDSLIRGVLTTSCQNQTLLIIHLDLILT